VDYDEGKVDEMLLAPLSLTMFNDGTGPRAWKGHDWDTLGRFYEKDYISNPKSKSE
jgi:hypothetical protein